MEGFIFKNIGQIVAEVLELVRLYGGVSTVDSKISSTTCCTFSKDRTFMGACCVPFKASATTSCLSLFLVFGVRDEQISLPLFCGTFVVCVGVFVRACACLTQPTTDSVSSVGRAFFMSLVVMALSLFQVSSLAGFARFVGNDPAFWIILESIVLLVFLMMWVGIWMARRVRDPRLEDHPSSCASRFLLWVRLASPQMATVALLGVFLCGGSN